MLCYLLLKSSKGLSSRPNRIYAVFVQWVLRCRLAGIGSYVRASALPGPRL